MGKGSQQTTSTSTTRADPQADALYRQILQRAQGVADTPYQAYGGELVAPVNAQQQTGINNINNSAGLAQPYLQEGADYARQGAAPVSASDIQHYLDPNVQNVVNATQAQFNNQNAQGQQGLTSQAIAQGALGGNRTGVAAANLANQQQLAQAPVISGLYSQAYSQALTAAQGDQQRKAAAAYSLGNIGTAAQNAGLSGATAQLGAGTLQQQTQQAQDTASYDQFMQQQAYPYQQTQWLAGLGTGVGSNLGGTSTGTTTQPKPDQTAQIIGAGLSAAALFSDERVKEGIEQVGHLNDGQKIYRFRYKGDPRWQIGLMHSNVERDKPEAAGRNIDGLGMVDYKKATEDAVERSMGGPVGLAGGGVPSMPWGNAKGWIPTAEISRGQGAPSGGGGGGGGGAQAGALDADKIIKNAMNLAKGLQGLGGAGSPMDISTPQGGGGFTPSPVGSFFEPTQAAGAGLGAFYRNGGRVGFADGGDPIYDENQVSPIDITGGDPGMSFKPTQTDRPDSFDSRFGDMPPAEANPDFVKGYGRTAGFDPAMFSGEGGTDVAQASVPLPQSRPQGLGSAPVMAQADEDDGEPAPAGAPTDITAARRGPVGLGASAGADLAAVPPEERAGLFLKMSPEVQAGLLATGLGLMATRSSNLGNAIGDAGLAGFGAYAGAKAQRAAEKMTAQKLAQQANKEAADLRLRTESQAETGRHNRATEAKDFKPSYGVIGEDPITGAKKYGWIDPNKQSTKSGASTSGEPGAEGTAGSGAIDPTLSGEAYASELERRNPGFAKTAKAVAEYRASITALSQRGGMREKILEAAQRINPDYDQTQYTAKNRARSNFAGGVEGRTVRSLNVAVDHLSTLREAAAAMQNGNIPMVNSIVNKFRQETGSNLATNFDSIKQVVSAEIAKAVVGGQTALHDRDEMAQRARNAASPDQLNGLINEFQKLMAGQMRGLRQAYEATTGLKDFDNYLMPETKKVLTGMGHGDKGGGDGGGAAPKRPASVPAGSGYSPSRQMWRDPSGKLYKADGSPAQ